MDTIKGSASIWGRVLNTKLRYIFSGTNLIDFVSSNQDILEHAGRDFAISLANIYIAALLIEQALSTQNKMDAITARNWTITRELCLVNHGQKTNIYRLLKSKDSFDIVFENYDREDAIIPWKY